MLVLRNPAQTSRISHPSIRSLAELRFSQVCADEPYDYDRHGYMIVVAQGDSVQQLEEESSCPILYNPYSETRYGDPDFTPSFDILEEHDECYEMLFLTTDEGFGITIFIPKTEGIAGDLLAMCAEYAKPAKVA